MKFFLLIIFSFFSINCFSNDNFLKIIIDIAPGYSSVNNIAREFSEQMYMKYSVNSIIENKPGRTLALELLSKNASNGKTILISTSSIVTTSVYHNIDLLNFVHGVSLLSKGPLIIVVNNSSKIYSVDEMIISAKKMPNYFNYASSGYGSIQHYFTVLFTKKHNIEMNHIPYKGVFPAIIDLVGNRIDFFMLSLTSALPFLNDNKIRGLALTDNMEKYNRWPVMKNFKANVWWGIFVSKNTPTHIINDLNTQIKSLNMNKDNKNDGMEFILTNSSEFNHLIDEEIKQWKNINLKLENL